MSIQAPLISYQHIDFTGVHIIRKSEWWLNTCGHLTLWNWWIDWSVDWLIDWLVNWLIDVLLDRSIDWLIHSSIERSIDWSIYWLIYWLQAVELYGPASPMFLCKYLLKELNGLLRKLTSINKLHHRMTRHRSMALCKTAVTPLLTNGSYSSLAPSHRENGKWHPSLKRFMVNAISLI